MCIRLGLDEEKQYLLIKIEYNTIKSYKFHDKQLLNIEKNDNMCFNQNTVNCTIFSVIVCEGTIECVYQISYIHENSQLALIER